ncbi:MAG TPA: hypothetical protein VFQ45_07640 [Longimicrobium sp.]|nr:hypothetical protein [Longimicrobium sp.]
MNARVQVMLDSRQIEALPADDDEVAGMWGKAFRSLRSSGLRGLDADAAFTLAYQAALQAATAVVRTAGYRVKGESHHHHTFAALAALDLGAVSEAGRDLNVIRQRRHGAIYDWQATTSERALRCCARPLSPCSRPGGNGSRSNVRRSPSTAHSRFSRKRFIPWEMEPVGAPAGSSGAAARQHAA